MQATCIPLLFTFLYCSNVIRLLLALFRCRENRKYVANYPKLDDNTVIKTEEGLENGIPHFYVTIDDILELFKDCSIIRIRHVDDCYFDGGKRCSKHYFILGSRGNDNR